MVPVPACWRFIISNKLTFDILTLKVVFESRATWATSVPILVFLGLSVLELGQMFATDRQTDVRRQTKASLNASALWVRRHNNNVCVCVCAKWNFGTFCRTVQVKLHLDGRLYIPIGNEPEVLDDWPLHRAKQVHSTRLYVGACWQGALTNSSPIPSTLLPLYRPHRSLIGQLHLVT